MEAKSHTNLYANSISSAAAGLTERIDLYRLNAYRDLEPAQRSEMGQFFTPPFIAQFMASFFGEMPPEIRLLDAGAGVGSLTAAFVEEACQRDSRPRNISVIAYELEPLLAENLHATMAECQEVSQEYGILSRALRHTICTEHPRNFPKANYASVR